MTDRERLIELLRKSGASFERALPEEIADYLLANGVIVPPCKVGDTVYPLNEDPRFRAFIEKISVTAEGMDLEWVQYDVGVDCTECWDDGSFTVDDIGKTVFLNEEEYLVALKERDGNDR